MTASQWQMLVHAFQQIREGGGDRDAAHALLRLLLGIAEPICASAKVTHNGSPDPRTEILIAFMTALRQVEERLQKDENCLPFLPARPLTPEIRAWALGQDTDNELMACLQEAKEKGGPELGELIRELEQEVQTSEHRS